MELNLATSFDHLGQGKGCEEGSCDVTVKVVLITRDGERVVRKGLQAIISKVVLMTQDRERAVGVFVM